MKKIGTYLLLLLIIVHAIFLVHYGISTFITTCLFYYIVYRLLKGCFYFIKDAHWQEVLIHNTRNVLLVMVAMEFVMTFVPPFTFLNNYMEHDKGVYFSEYKRKLQCSLLQDIGFKKARFIFEEGNLPDSRRLLRRREYSYWHTYNQLGLRGKLPSVQKDSNEFRIILLGDSFIEGDGASDDSTVSVLLEQKLNVAGLGCKFKVINGGVAGSNPLYTHPFYNKYLRSYHPDIVVQAYFSNDLWDVFIQKDQGKLPAYEYCFALSHIYRFIFYGVLKYNNFFTLHPPTKTLMDKKLLLRILMEDNLAFRQESATDSIKFISMYIPAKNEVLNTSIYLKKEDEIAGHAQYDIQLLSEFTPYLDNNAKRFVKKYYWKHDAHFNAKGYDLVATILTEKVKGYCLKINNTVK